MFLYSSGMTFSRFLLQAGFFAEKTPEPDVMNV